MQAVHGKYFSRRKWEKFLRSRAVPGSGVSFAEIEVMLCNVPSIQELMEEEDAERREIEGNAVFTLHSKCIHISCAPFAFIARNFFKKHT